MVPKAKKAEAGKPKVPDQPELQRESEPLTDKEEMKRWLSS